MANIATDLTNVTFHKGECIKLNFLADDLDSATLEKFASVTFTFGSNFFSIASGVDFIIFGKTYTTGVGDGLVDLSSADLETNISAFAEFLYSRFEFNGLFAPPSSYGDNFYTFAAPNGEVKIVWIESGLIDPFEFSTVNLTGSTSIIYAGANDSGKKNYKVLYRIYDGIKPISNVFALPLLSRTKTFLPTIELKGLLENHVGTSDISLPSILGGTTPFKDEKMYKEFYLRYGSRWTEGDSCMVKHEDFKKTLTINLKNTCVGESGFLTSSKLTNLCEFSDLNLWAVGAIFRYTIQYESPLGFFFSVNTILASSDKEIHSIPVGNSIFQLDKQSGGVPANMRLASAIITLYNASSGVIDKHRIIITDCSCCTKFYYQRKCGGWDFACLKPTQNSVKIVRSETCIFGCGETTTSKVSSATKEVEYEMPNVLLMDIVESPNIYYSHGGKLISVRVKEGTFNEESTKLTIIE